MHSPVSTRKAKAVDAFEAHDADKSRAVHDARTPFWEEDGHNAGEAAEASYRRVDAVQCGLCGALALESAFGRDATRGRLVGCAVALAAARGLQRASGGAWYKRHYQRERAREEWELENYADGEREEMVGLWVHKGLRRGDADSVIATLAGYKEFFVNIMMVEELKMFAPVDDLTQAALDEGLCAFLGGAGPLLLGGLAEYAAPLSDAFPDAALATLAVVAAATSALAATAIWRAQISRLPEQRHALEAVCAGLACFLVPKVLPFDG
eukprot:CAMPEP_0119269704 /NCGR_PEP_ID=MMETSP1329-20130426/7002_1 /TAXON_ID=114041 /ORGANISM="Genus nov. species nov., Strain RCC1024" /LENGTH=266 /DNA_ID=CAMNT_0007269705 /DNA_START=211 /DNA_END=1009 /DNA_ORIENTATION=-